MGITYPVSNLRECFSSFCTTYIAGTNSLTQVPDPKVVEKSENAYKGSKIGEQLNALNTTIYSDTRDRKAFQNFLNNHFNSTASPEPVIIKGEKQPQFSEELSLTVNVQSEHSKKDESKAIIQLVEESDGIKLSFGHIAVNSTLAINFLINLLPPPSPDDGNDGIESDPTDSQEEGGLLQWIINNKFILIGGGLCFLGSLWAIAKKRRLRAEENAAPVASRYNINTGTTAHRP